MRAQKGKLSLPTGFPIEPLFACGQRAAHALDDYVAIHDVIFRLSIRRVLPLLTVFAPIDFAACAAGLDAVSQELTNVQKELASFRATNPALGVAEPLLSALEQYVPALLRSASLLRSICLRLAAKAQRTRKYNWGEYRRDLDQYRESVDHYVRQGADLNRAIASSRN